MFFGLDGNTFEGGAILSYLFDVITNDDIGIDIGKGILDFAHCCSSSFVIFFCQKLIYHKEVYSGQ